MSLPPRAPFIRSRPVTFLASARRHVLTTWLAGAVIFAFLNAVPRAAWAYVFEGASWPAGTTVVLQLGLGDAGRTLIDGNTFLEHCCRTGAEHVGPRYPAGSAYLCNLDCVRLIRRWGELGRLFRQYFWTVVWQWDPRGDLLQNARLAHGRSRHPF